MAGVSTKEIKNRIRSLESTKQITKAMEMVASSKLRRAQDQVRSSRPYFEILYDTIQRIAGANREFSSPYLAKSEGKKPLYIVIAGDRGLAGGYNSNVIKAVTEKMRGDIPTCILPIGKRAVDFCTRKGIEIVTKEFAEAGSISITDCFAISNLVTQGYLSGQFDEVSIIYTQFVSMLTQVPSAEELLPLKPEGGQAREDLRSLVLYEPSPEEVYDAIVPGYIAGMIYGAMCESVASEQGARRTAMDAASKNAAEMIESLSLSYNRARQGAITQEITEIVAGAEH